MAMLYGYLNEVLIRFKYLLGGGSLMVIAAGTIEHLTSHSVTWQIYIWLVAACFFVALIGQGVSQYKRLQPRIVIRNLRSRTWTRDNGEAGNECWIEVFNPSSAASLELVQAEIIAIRPDLFGYLPLPLHVKHDPSYAQRDFSVNPGSIGMVDLITGPASQASAQKGLIIPHTIGGGWSQMPPQEYIFTLRVSAHDVPPAEAIFKAWIGEDGALKCVQL